MTGNTAPDGASLRTLRNGDEARLEAFLSARPESSLFLLSNAEAAGLEDRGAPYQATYVAALEGDEIAGVAAHCWNGVLVLQAPAHLEAVARAAAERSGRRIRGICGPLDQTIAARRALGLNSAATTLESRDDLYALGLDRLVVPGPLASGEVLCRLPAPGELDRLVAWRVQYARETLGAEDSDGLAAGCREEVERLQAMRRQWVLERAGELVSYTAFNARIPDMVQVGGVFTPAALRGRGYARAVVAGSLLAARSDGASRAVLFTDKQNASAGAAYDALGFRIVGEYGLVLFAE